MQSVLCLFFIPALHGHAFFLLYHLFFRIYRTRIGVPKRDVSMIAKIYICNDAISAHSKRGILSQVSARVDPEERNPRYPTGLGFSAAGFCPVQCVDQPPPLRERRRVRHRSPKAIDKGDGTVGHHWCTDVHGFSILVLVSFRFVRKSPS